MKMHFPIYIKSFISTWKWEHKTAVVETRISFMSSFVRIEEPELS